MTATMTATARPPTAERLPTGSRRPCARSSAATCRCGCAPGTAPRPARPTRPLVELRSPDAVRRLLWHPGELGAAQAYVTGELDVPGGRLTSTAP